MCFFLHTLTGEKWHENDAKNGIQNVWARRGVRNTCTSEMTTIPDGGGYMGDYALLQEKRFGGHALGCARKYVSASG